MMFFGNLFLDNICGFKSFFFTSRANLLDRTWLRSDGRTEEAEGVGVRTAVRGSTRLSRSEVGTSTPARSRCSDRRTPAETGPVSAGGFAEKFRMREKK